MRLIDWFDNIVNCKLKNIKDTIKKNYQYLNSIEKFLIINSLLAIILWTMVGILLYSEEYIFFICKSNPSANDEELYFTIFIKSVTIVNQYEMLFIPIFVFLFIPLIIYKCPTIEEYNVQPYNPQLYAELQSEKATYPLIGSVISLGSFMSMDSLDFINIGKFLLSCVVLLLSTMSYRHFTYAVYMQESKKQNKI